ncbi:pyridoxamine 5'-phosphate oxidase family protein [Paracoccus sp. PAR01]|uniref:pyridoxamine 5'-phosphate oxidase family protein n=1 Tax=Paracoccus TaxID=265 RepID=UPI0017833DA6|nr:pyridoxamine 5'-phosphate oxidase family protein [Paracoccus sp. PAR01]MBD9529435.1 pyridoxamine 5'-phosphate oxidase family protein [Paracoccus sp. PAR01]
MANEQQTFWKRLDGINAGMLGTRERMKLVPMSHYADPGEQALWFITAEGTDLVSELEDGSKPAIHVIGDAAGKLWAQIEGQLELSPDRAKLDEIWNKVAAAWFEGGKEDPDLRLLRFSLSEADIWSTTGGIGFLYQIAKANLTGDEPDIGDHFHLKF